MIIHDISLNSSYMRNVSGKRCRENQNAHLMFSNFFFFKSRAIYEIMGKNVVKRDRPQMTIWHMCFVHNS